MEFFKYLTPAVYLLLILTWAFILYFYTGKLTKSNSYDKLLKTLLFVLALDAFRTLVESSFFGIWFSSNLRILPYPLYEFLNKPEIVFIPKLFSLAVSVYIMLFLIKRWIPAEISRRNKMEESIQVKTRELQQTIESLEATQQQLKESELKYFSIFSNNPNPGWIYNEETLQFLEVNNAAVLHYGYSKGEFLNMTIKDIRPADDIPSLLDDINNTRINFNRAGVWRHVRKNGEIIYVEIISHAVEFNGVSARHVAAHDITENIKLQKANYEAERRYRNLYENLSIGIYQSAPTGEILMANPSLIKMLGFDSLEALQQRNLEKNGYLDMDQREVFKSILHEKDEILGLESDWLCENGSILNVRESAKAIRDTEGKIQYYEGTVENITEKKNAERQRDNERVLLHTILNHIPHAIYLKDIELRYIFVNRTALDDMGLNPDANIIGKRDTDLFPSSIAEKFIQEDREVFATQQASPGKEEKLQLKNGRVKWVINSKIPYLDANGQMRGVFGIGFDTTELKKSRQLLDLKDKALNSAANAIIITDNNGKIEWVNQAFCDLTQYTEEECIGKNPRDLVKSGLHDVAFYKNLWDTILSGKIWIGTFINRRKTGELYHEEELISPVYDDSGKISHFVGIKSDITQRIVIENELKDAREKAESMLMESVKQNLEIELQNDRLESLLRISQYTPQSTQEFLDYALKEAIQLTASKIGYIYFYDEILQQFILNTWSNDVMKECKIMNPQTVYKLEETGCWGEAVRQRRPIMMNDFPSEHSTKKGTPDGHVRLEKFLTIPVFSDQKIVAVVGVANKETDYMQSDIRQLTLLMDMVWKVLDRQYMIKDLHLAKEKAEESDKLKSAFLANMSHEIRTPMNGILGFSELLKTPGLSSEKQSEYIDIIKKSGDRMLNIINDIIDISKIESGLMEIHLSETNVNEQFGYIYTFFEPECQRKGISLTLSNGLNSEKAFISSDKEKIYAILINLVKNAIKYTDGGKIEMGYVLKTSGHGHPGTNHNGSDMLEFFVKDTGIGIPEDRQTAIFDRFVQADIADKRAFEGAGLGLSISKAYIEMLGGTIWVESIEGTGSVFYFSIPYHPLHIAKTSTVISAKPNEAHTQLKKLKVLLVEDDETSQMLIRIVIDVFSREVLNATSGSEAVQICRDNPDIDLVIMDIKLPDMNGYDATRQIRGFNQDVIIIAQTSYSMTGDREKALQAGCNDYIAKPIIIDDLIAIIKEIYGITSKL